jgi:hypothetical protein
MTTLMQAHEQWAKRPADERFLSLHEMQAKMRYLQDRSEADVQSPQDRRTAPVALAAKFGAAQSGRVIIADERAAGRTPPQIKPPSRRNSRPCGAHRMLTAIRRTSQ